MGTESFNDNSCYTGMFVFGIKEGKGKFVWSDGSNYEGDLKGDNLEGFGVYKWSDGR